MQKKIRKRQEHMKDKRESSGEQRQTRQVQDLTETKRMKKNKDKLKRKRTKTKRQRRNSV